jgi:predicted nucleic acid-binding protein
MIELQDVSQRRTVFGYLGTIGILVRCVDKDIISFSESNVIVTKMIEKGYMSPVNNLEELSPLTEDGGCGSD